jgi:hypothetical protein
MWMLFGSVFMFSIFYPLNLHNKLNMLYWQTYNEALIGVLHHAPRGLSNRVGPTSWNSRRIIRCVNFSFHFFVLKHRQNWIENWISSHLVMVSGSGCLLTPWLNASLIFGLSLFTIKCEVVRKFWRRLLKHLSLQCLCFDPQWSIHQSIIVV